MNFIDKNEQTEQATKWINKNLNQILLLINKCEKLKMLW